MKILEKALIKSFEFVKDFLFYRKENPPLGSLYIGTSQSLYDRSKTEEIYLSGDDINCHVYLAGATGSGKSTCLLSFIRQHILLGRGFCLIDPHGDLSDEVVKFVASIFQNKTDREKLLIARRLIFVEPDVDALVGFNPLERGNSSAYQTLLELMGVFRNRWGDSFSLGPRTEEVFRNCLDVLIENDLTLLEVSHFLVNKKFRSVLLKNVANEEVKNFWLNRYDKLPANQQGMFRDPVANKVTELTSDPFIRLIVGQQKSTFDFRRAMDTKKWVVLNVRKAQLKTNALLLASLFLAKLQMAGLSRSNIAYSQRKPFYVLIDEFQDFSLSSVSEMETLLAQARKFCVFLTMAHQNVFQLERKLTEAILGNARTLLIFRVSHTDASMLAPELNPLSKEFLVKKLVELETGEAFLKFRGRPQRLTKLPLPPTPVIASKIIEELKNLSFSFYTKTSREIEEEIRQRHEKFGLNGGQTRDKTDKKENSDEW